MASSLSKSEKTVWEFGILCVIGFVTMLIGTPAAQALQRFLVESGLTQNIGLVVMVLGCWLFGYYLFKNIRRSSLYTKTGLVMVTALVIGALFGTGFGAAMSTFSAFASGYWVGYAKFGSTPR